MIDMDLHGFTFNALINLGDKLKASLEFNTADWVILAIILEIIPDARHFSQKRIFDRY